MKFETIIELIQYRDSVEHNLRITKMAIDRGFFTSKEDETNTYRRLIGIKAEINRIDILMSHILNTQYKNAIKECNGLLQANADMFAGISDKQADETNQTLDLFPDDEVILTQNEFSENNTQTQCSNRAIAEKVNDKTNENIVSEERILQDTCGKVELNQILQGETAGKVDTFTRIQINKATGQIETKGSNQLSIEQICGSSNISTTTESREEKVEYKNQEVSNGQENIEPPVEIKESRETTTESNCWSDVIKARDLDDDKLSIIVCNSITKKEYVYTDDEGRLEDRMFGILKLIKHQGKYVSMVYATILFDVLKKLIGNDFDALAKYRSFLNETIFKSLINANNPVLAFLQVRMVMPSLCEYEVAKIIRKSVFAELNPGNKIKYEDFLKSDIVPLFSTKAMIANDQRTLKFIGIVYGGGIDARAKFQEIWMQVDLVPAEVRAELARPETVTTEDKKVEYEQREPIGIITKKAENGNPNSAQKNEILTQAQIVSKMAKQYRILKPVNTNYRIKH